jgi:hypothetical protein
MFLALFLITAVGAVCGLSKTDLRSVPPVVFTAAFIVSLAAFGLFVTR